MKKLLLILLLGAIILPALGQAKKVAILETVDRDGSVSYAHKLMLRANLAKAITNTPGYEAYDRTDMDAILGEQNFQRTGMVSDDQIKRLGEMTGAEYILVAEAVKVDDANLFITAKILNVETAQTERTDNALMNMSATDIQHGCESLANKLLGLSANASSNVDKTSSQTPQKNSAVKDFFNNLSSQHATKKAKTGDDKIEEQTYTNPLIGTLKTFEDGTAGIVFYTTNDGHGLVVALYEITAKWYDGKKYVDITTINNDENLNASMISGFNNTNAMLTQLGTIQAPAAAYCRTMGANWYLPTAGELIYLLKIANKGQKTDGPISKALMENGGGYLEGWYWSSSEYKKDEAWNISASGWDATEDKKDALKVRPIRAF